ncbi:MAG: molybdopterin-dependent oxidoreductase [Anaerolinea sp.]|nr:molybdopterin-dependent oxidoreductase [Anaerolinea sp.]
MRQNQPLSQVFDETLISRRTFMKWGTALAGTAALASTLSPTLVKSAAADVPAAAGESQLMTTACYHNCGGRCILYAEVQDGVVKRIVPDVQAEDGVDMPRATPCVRGRTQINRVYAAERLKYPMKRVGERGENRFERITWEEALDTIANEMIRLKEAYGNESFFFHYASGTQWRGPDGRAPIRRLLSLFGGFTGYYGTYSSACYSAATPYITGIGSNSVDDMLNSRLVVLFSDNPVVTRNGGDGSGYYCMKAKENGTRFISVDPVLNDSAVALDAEWIPINPGTDVALIAALAYVMVQEDIYDRDFMATHSVGFDESTLPEGAPPNSSWMAYIMGDADGIAKTPEWAAPITGIPVSRIVQLAREIALTKPCCLIQGLGWQRRAYGEQPVRALPILAAMSGNFGIPGGGTGMRSGNGTSIKSGGFPEPTNPIEAQIPVFLWPDFITRGTEMTALVKDGDGLRGAESLSANMKFMWNHGGNCITNQHSDINGTIEMLRDDSKLELIVTSEVMMTPSCLVSDILLPAATGFEADNLITGLGAGRANWLMYSHQVIEPLFESRTDLWVAEQLAERLGILEQYQEGHATREDWMREMVAVTQAEYPDFPTFEEFKEVGIYKRFTAGQVVAGAAFREDPVANPLPTETGKIEIFSPYLYSLNYPEGMPAIPMYIPEWEGVSDPLRERFPLLMTTNHAVHRSHSTFANVEILQEAHQHVVMINTLDAAARGIQSGDTVRVFNDRGTIELKARVTPRIRPGNVNVWQGTWHKPDANGVDVGGCCNTLTKYHPTPFAKGNPQHTNLVQVEKV